jgi:hypothetical protein
LPRAHVFTRDWDLENQKRFLRVVAWSVLHAASLGKYQLVVGRTAQLVTLTGMLNPQLALMVKQQTTCHTALRIDGNLARGSGNVFLYLRHADLLFVYENHYHY